MGVQSYRDLGVWQQAMDFAAQAYELTSDFPDREKYGLTSQLRRSAVSVPSNIAEGHSRDSTCEFLHYFSITMGSLSEAETQVLLAARLGYAASESVESILETSDHLGRQLRNLQKSLKAKLPPRSSSP